MLMHPSTCLISLGTRALGCTQISMTWHTFNTCLLQCCF